tara:strand:- start:212 stop:433 length:222 start_codon:yes stop_codon:yes gene_type:complete
LDGNLPSLRGGDRLIYGIYYQCATSFGWDKETTDKQPVEYLEKLFSAAQEAAEQARKDNKLPPIPRNMAKNFK